MGTVFLQGFGEFRDGHGTLDMDVRSTLYAFALNLGLTTSDVYVTKFDGVIEQLGLYSVVDPFYTFPPMQRLVRVF